MAATPVADEEETAAKLNSFLQWLEVNGAVLRGCRIRRCAGPGVGFGVFSTGDNYASTGGGDDDRMVMAVPLDLAITPMRVLQDPLLGPRCRALFDEGGVDDRLLVMLFLIVERLKLDSLWKPYLDMLPNAFGTPLWFSDVQLLELKGTTLYRATLLQRKSLQALYHDKVKGLVEELLDFHQLERVRKVEYKDFLWANSIFWTRALNIPFPHSYVFPEPSNGLCDGTVSKGPVCGSSMREPDDDGETKSRAEPIWAEGLVPGIDFCNHGLRAVATWEVDPVGTITGIPASMYLVLADEKLISGEVEICINYGNKGNEELLYLYGFVMDNNPDDYLMVHYPMEALQQVPLYEKKAVLLDIQKSQLRCLLPRNLLANGFFSSCQLQDDDEMAFPGKVSNYSWSGHRKVPSYLNKFVFPQEFIASLRTIAMQEHELVQISSLLQELAGAVGRQPTESEIQTAIWEVCGDYGALELLVDLLHVKMTELVEASGTEASDEELLKIFDSEGRDEQFTDYQSWRNCRSSVIYRRGQKQLLASFLREAEHALELCAREQA